MARTLRGLVARAGTMCRAIGLGIIALICPLFTNCYGQFPLTKAVYEFNGAVDAGILQQVVFWVFVIVPVYGVAILADALVLNLIEFWSGDGLSIGSIKNSDGSVVSLRPSADGREALMTVSRDGVDVAQARFVRVSETVCEVWDSSGRLTGRAVRVPAGDLQLTDAEGCVIGTITAGQLAVLKARAKRVPTESL